jgi:hypothetical protein
MAEKSYEANSAVKGIADGITDFMNGQQAAPASFEKEEARPEQPKEQKNH